MHKACANSSAIDGKTRFEEYASLEVFCLLNSLSLSLESESELSELSLSEEFSTSF